MLYPQNKLQSIYLIKFLFLFLTVSFTGSFAYAYADESTEPAPAAAPELSIKAFESKPGVPVEINGDQVEFIMEGNKVIAKGNVVIIRDQTTLTADRVELSRDTNIAIAEGNVVLWMPQGKISGDKMTFNFKSMTGDFTDAKVSTAPYYGAGAAVEKVSEKQITMKEGYMTTCDLTKPHYRAKSQKVDIYPGDKIVARNVRMLVGNSPLLYVPKITQKLNDKPRVIFTPGYDKDWGVYLLSRWRFYFDENFKGTIHVDGRERKGLAEGIDLDYKIPNKGSGIIRTYYINERPLSEKHIWEEEDPDQIPQHERLKVEWRHQWEIDPNTQMNLQYYRVSGPTFLKDYFKREYEANGIPNTFFLLTHNVANGTLSLRADKRVNRFVAETERLPEVRYDISNQRIGNLGLYVKSQNGYVNLSKKDASPTEVRKETMRFDSNNELSYPMKISFIELRPFVGQQETFYSKTTDPLQYNIIRGIFRTGADLSTKFYRMFDVDGKYWGIEINKLRHVITPSVAYLYQHRPTVVPSLLDVFDSVDTLDRSHAVVFSLENKLQTKRQGSAVDLFRSIVSTDFNLKENPTKGGFNRVKTQMEFKPASWLRFDGDTDYDTQRDKLAAYNWELSVNQDNKWDFGLGRRFALEADDQITMELNYRINPKWKFKIYRRFDVDGDTLKEQEYTVTRDLHCWEMDINFNETRGEGSEIWFVFRLKAFPDFGFDFGTSFHKRKAGSQSTIGQ